MVLLVVCFVLVEKVPGLDVIMLDTFGKRVERQLCTITIKVRFILALHVFVGIIHCKITSSCFFCFSFVFTGTSPGGCPHPNKQLPVIVSFRGLVGLPFSVALSFQSKASVRRSQSYSWQEKKEIRRLLYFCLGTTCAKIDKVTKLICIQGNIHPFQISWVPFILQRLCAVLLTLGSIYCIYLCAYSSAILGHWQKIVLHYPSVFRRTNTVLFRSKWDFPMSKISCHPQIAVEARSRVLKSFQRCCQNFALWMPHITNLMLSFTAGTISFYCQHWKPSCKRSASLASPA